MWGCSGGAATERVLDPATVGKAETLPDAAAEATEQPLPPPPGTEAFSLWRTFKELPWHVVPFLFGMFALVEALQQGGWVDFFAGVRLAPRHLLLRAVSCTRIERSACGHCRAVCQFALGYLSGCCGLRFMWSSRGLGVPRP